jgi:cholest-4-en-3-one 26-monooxygenase
MNDRRSELTLTGTELEPEVFQRGIPHALFKRLRHEKPVCWYPGPEHGYWCITRHANVLAVSKDTETFSSQAGGVGIGDPARHGPDMTQSILTTDPPDHQRLRRAVLPPLKARAASLQEPYLRGATQRILERVLSRQEFDFAQEIARELPVRALAHLLGAPEDQANLDRMVGWTQAALYFDDNPDPAAGAAALDRAVAEIEEYGRELTSRKRQHPEDDLLSGLVRKDHEGGALTDEEIAQMFAIFAIAGSDSTRQTVTHGMLAFIEHPDQWQQLRADRSLLPQAVEEVLRWASVALSFGRMATKDVTMEGVTIRAGDRVVLWYASANFDEDVFANPYQFDIGRKPNPHCSFGGRGGPHMCVGANLARVEIKVMLEELLDRIPRLELAGPVRRMPSNMDNGIATMPVRIVS